MEHRLYPRNSSDFAVTLNNPRFGSVDARVRDISQEGISVHLDDMPYPPGTLLEVAIPKDQQQHYHAHAGIKAFVIHAKEGEIGLWLLEPNELL